MTRRSITAVADGFVTCTPSCNAGPTCAEHWWPACVRVNAPAAGGVAGELAARPRGSSALLPACRSPAVSQDRTSRRRTLLLPRSAGVRGTTFPVLRPGLRDGSWRDIPGVVLGLSPDAAEPEGASSYNRLICTQAAARRWASGGAPKDSLGQYVAAARPCVAGSVGSRITSRAGPGADSRVPKGRRRGSGRAGSSRSLCGGSPPRPPTSFRLWRSHDLIGAGEHPASWRAASRVTFAGTPPVTWSGRPQSMTAMAGMSPAG